MAAGDLGDLVRAGVLLQHHLPDHPECLLANVRPLRTAAPVAMLRGIEPELELALLKVANSRLLLLAIGVPLLVPDTIDDVLEPLPALRDIHGEDPVPTRRHRPNVLSAYRGVHDLRASIEVRADHDFERAPVLGEQRSVLLDRHGARRRSIVTDAILERRRVPRRAPDDGDYQPLSLEPKCDLDGLAHPRRPGGGQPPRFPPPYRRSFERSKS